AIRIVDSNQFGLSNCLTILSNDFGEVFFNLCKSFADKLKKATSLAEIIPEQNNKTTIAIASIITTFVSKAALSKIIEFINGSGSKVV
ncbi:MAG TPA: hypothetical protein PK124_07135, partial [Bacteroidales bacterium]|nr:hypothetical protein [Bacteroidales bacterium]